MKSIRLIKPYFAENRLFIFLGLACLITVDFLQLLIPRVIKWTVDDLTAFRADFNQLLIYALYIAGLALMIGFFRFIWRRCLIGLSRQVEEGLRNRLFSHIQTLSASYFDRVKTGDLMAHATNDIQNVRMATGMGVVALTDAVVLGTASIGFMAYIHPRLTVLVLIPMPFIVLGARFFSKRMHRLYQQVQGTFSSLTETVRERLAGIRTLKAYNGEEEALSKMGAVSREYIDINLRLVRITGSFFPMMLLFSNLSLAIVLFFGGRQTITATITPGDFVAFISYLGLLTWPMMAFGWVTNLIQRGTASLDRINKILQTRPQIDDAQTAIPADRIRGEIVFENVSFSYQSNPDTSGTLPVLAGVDLRVKPGQFLGIIGPPGSGKTTLLSLIPRLYDVSHGRILADGIDIREIKVRDLRTQISFMPQEPFLFAGTIRENITFNHPAVKDPDLIQAVTAASLLDTIKSFPDGFETVVGEKGIILSGGQKQRMALARSLLHDSPALILDDPISQVDMETGAAIINYIRSLVGNKTIVLASHRLSALRFADQILVLDKGRIVESGTHRQLMEQDRYYANTCRLQEIEEEFHEF